MASRRHLAGLIGLLFAVFAGSTPFLVDSIFDTANLVPPVLDSLARTPDVVSRAPPIAMPGVIVLVDGLRVDEADRMPSMRKLRASGAWGTTRTTQPSLSRPFYHALMTGVPPAGTGVRTNRFRAKARLDSLAERVRDAGRPCHWVSESLDWFHAMFGREGEAHPTSRAALDAPLDAALAVTAGGGGPGLLVVHVLDVDESAHRGGIRTEDHAQALRMADGVLARVERATRGRDVALLVVSDHGHIDPGGHGGAEEEVALSPWALRAPTLASRRVEEPLLVTELAPTLASWMGVAAPVSAVSPPRADLVNGPAPDPIGPNERSRLMAGATRAALADLRLARILLVTVIAMLALLGASALVLSFRTDVGTIVTPLLWSSVVAVVHIGIWGRPLSLSAIDDIDRHAPRLGITGAIIAVGSIALVVALLVRWRDKTRPRMVALVGSLQRSSAALGLHCVVLLGLSIAWIGGSMGPWPLPSDALYAPILVGALGAGACAVSAVAVLATALLPAPSARSRADAPAPARVESVSASHVERPG